MIKGILIRPLGGVLPAVEEVEFEKDDLDQMQEWVGGLVEPVRLSDGSSLYVNEEGSYKFGPDHFNSIATDVCGLGGRADILIYNPILGPALLVGPLQGEWDSDVTDQGRRWVKRVAGEAL